MTTATVVTVSDFAKSNGITLSSVRTGSNPNMADSANMDHWKVTLKSGGRRMTLTFSKGYGHHGAEPTVDEVLECLSSDAAGVANSNGFEDWCGEYGFDPDSRRAEKIWKACTHQAARLNTFLGSEAFEQLLWHTDRL